MLLVTIKSVDSLIWKYAQVRDRLWISKAVLIRHEAGRSLAE
jgi:hypothetical protein